MTQVTGNSPRGDALCRFYTNPLIGKLLVKLVASRPPTRVVDLGSGSGILTKAARARWKRSEIVTVDIDGDTARFHQPNSRHSRHVHHTHDALDVNLPRILLRREGFDTAICNPPFTRPAWRPDFERLLTESGLADAYSSIVDVAAEDLFLAQTLRLTKPGGRIGLIVPDGTVTARRSEGLRTKLLGAHRIESVVQLPRHSFQATDAQAFILVLSNGSPSKEKIALSKFDDELGLSAPLFIEADAAQFRLDYDYHCAQAKRTTTPQRTLSSLVTEVRRGSLSSAEIKRAKCPVFHTSGFTHTNGNIRLPGRFREKANARDLPAIAKPGDILVARVDRLLHLKVGIVISGSAAISDCIWRIRVPARYRNIAINALRSAAGISYLNSVARGVSARMLAKADLLSLPVPPLRRRR